MTGAQTGHSVATRWQPHGLWSRTPRSHNQRSSPALAKPSTSSRMLARMVVPLLPAPTTERTFSGRWTSRMRMLLFAGGC